MNESQKRKLVRAFTGSLPLQPDLEPHLRQALSSVLKNPGSLIRPEIVLQVGMAYGLLEASATDLAIGLEYFHTASLLFDDLPSMDDSLERRGGPCAHVQFGEAGAILAALALVNRAYALTWRAVLNSDRELQTRSVNYLEHHLGIGGLLNGQSMDLHFGSLPQNLETTERVAIGKTVSLIRLTLVLPALVGGAPPADLHLLDRVARFWGLSYQIVDDLRDVLQTSEESGKTNSRDVFLGRPNIALAIGVVGATERLTRLIGLGDKAFARLTASKPDLDFLASLRAQLGQEARQLTRSACETPLGACA